MKRLLIICVFIFIFANDCFAAKLLFDFNDRYIGAYNTNDECVRARKADININYGGNNNIKYKVFWEERDEWWEIGTETINVNNADNNENLENNKKSNVIYAGSSWKANSMLTTEQLIMQGKRSIIFPVNNEAYKHNNGEFMTKEEAIMKREMNKDYVRSNSTSRAIIYNTKDRKETITY